MPAVRRRQRMSKELRTMLTLSRKKKILALGLAAAACTAAAFGAVVFGGVMTVAATDAHSVPVEWMLETTMASSVRAHAADIEVPSGIDLRDPAQAERAFGHYSVACTPCHGAPGVAAAPWLVLNPPAEPLVDTADRWSDAELYWIVKHGIKMTGMPALGPTHGDDDLWAIAAFVRQLPEMSPEAYAEMASRHDAKMRVAMGAPVDDAPVQIDAAHEPAAHTEHTTPPVAAPTEPATPAKRKVKAQPRREREAEASAAPTKDVAPPSPAPTQGAHTHHHH
jgi:mono/diheme cytochrome c family protein